MPDAMRTGTRGGITFEWPDADIVVRCSNGHDTFNLIVQVRVKGALSTRVARCTTCGETEGIDPARSDDA